MALPLVVEVPPSDAPRIPILADAKSDPLRSFARPFPFPSHTMHKPLNVAAHPCALRATLRYARLASAGLLSLLPAWLVAQSTGAADSADQADDGVVTLSAFVVNTDGDTDYLAANTTAGTRLNTSLLDTPASISELTPEFLNDINAETMLQAVEYSLGFAEEVGDNDNAQKEFAAAISARGLPRAAIARSASRNYFIWYLNSDSYNTERLSLSRGPNSILFGLGEPGGMINQTTKRPHFRDQTTLGFKANSEGSVRATLDWEKVLTPKLALRANLLVQDNKTWRELEYDKKQALHLATAYQLTANTILNFEFERSINDQLKAQPWSAGDKAGGWFDAGSLAYDRTVSTTRPAGVNNIGGNPYLVLDSDADVYRNFQNYGIGAAPSTGRKISDPNIVPYEALIAGKASTTNNDYWTYSAFVEHRFADNLSLEVAYNRQADHRLWERPLRTGEIAVKVDPNKTISGGIANPNFGKLYVEDWPRYKDINREVDNLRATLAYEFDTGSEWLGRHRLIAFASREAVDYSSPDIQLANTTPFGTTAALKQYTNAQNRIYLRTYLDFNGGNRAYAHDPFSQLPPTMAFSDPERNLSGTITPGWYINTLTATKETTTSFLLAGQSYFARNRLAITYGYRKDSLDQEIAAEHRDAVTNAVTSWDYSGDSDTFKGNTYTGGVVYHVNDWISAYANLSDNFQPQSALDINNRNMGNIVGEGQDFGLKFNLLEKRLYATLGYYHVAAANRRQFNASQYMGAINNIWDALGQGADKVETDFTDTSDFEGHGYELELVGKLTKGLSISANFAANEGEATNIDPRIRAYVEQNRATWAAADQTLTAPGSSQTIAAALAHIDQELIDDRLAEGVNALGNTKYTLNVVTKYQFQSGPLKPWSVGLNFRYRADTVIGYDPDQKPFYADPYWLADLNIGYRTKLRNNTQLTMGLNVQNLFDETDLVYVRASSTGELTHYKFQTPRLMTFTASLGF